MISIFYDLETTDLNPIGQILNYSFIAIDENWKEISRCAGKIKLDRTQLPHPSAILANGINVLEHNSENIPYEFDAMKKIHNYISDIYANSSNKVYMIGFNSARFDLPFLRTSMIRNGLNPFFGRDLINRDVIHVVKKLLVSSDNFVNRTQDEKLCFKLEHLTKKLGLLEGKQLHESTFDVILTIKLAHLLYSDYGIDVRTYEAYEPRDYEKLPYVVEKTYLDSSTYTGNTKSPETTLMTCLDSDYKYALWIDLLKFQDSNITNKKDCISWYNKNGSVFYYTNVSESQEHMAIALEAKEYFSDINLTNYFPDKNCDVEQYIYMMDFKGIDLLNTSIWYRNSQFLNDSDNVFAKVLYLRYLFKKLDSVDKLKNEFKKYSLYRYGGQLKTNKWDAISTYNSELYKPEDFHITFNKLIEETNKLLKIEKKEHNISNLKALKEYYFESDVYKLCSNEFNSGSE